MTEDFILKIIPERTRQLGYHNYHIRYKDLTIQGGVTKTIISYTDHHFIVDDPQGLMVESDFGIYDSTGAYMAGNAHEHKGEIVIVNPGPDSKRIKFIQLIIVN